LVISVQRFEDRRSVLGWIQVTRWGAHRGTAVKRCAITNIVIAYTAATSMSKTRARAITAHRLASLLSTNQAMRLRR
jgi:hypothetical protein